MQYTARCPSPLGEILLACDEEGLTGLWFEGQKYFGSTLPPDRREALRPPLEAARRWLELYFSGRDPGFTPPLHLVGTPFRLSVWQALLAIPRGTVTTYGALAASLPGASARAVGAAVGRNPISLIVPCHRVVGAGGQLTGYAGGLERKRALLTLEGVPCSGPRAALPLSDKKG